MINSSCPTYDVICWNISQSASAYAQLASVVASILVAAIILSFSNPPKDSQQTKDISLPLYSCSVAAFSLLLSSFLFSLLTGEETTTRAYILGLASFATLAVGLLQVMLSIIWFFKVYDLNVWIVMSAIMLFQGLMLLETVYVLIFLIDIVRIKAHYNNEYPDVLLMLFPYLILTYGIPWVAAFILRKRWYPKVEKSGAKVDTFLFKFIRSPEVSFAVVSTCSGIFVLLATFAYGVVLIAFENMRQHINNIDINIYLLMIVGVEVILIILFFLYQLSIPDTRKDMEGKLSSQKEKPIEVASIEKTHSRSENVLSKGIILHMAFILTTITSIIMLLVRLYRRKKGNHPN